MGYSLSENHFADIRALFPTGEGYWIENTTDATNPTFREPGTDESLGYYYIDTYSYSSGDEIDEALFVRLFVTAGVTCGYRVSYKAEDTNHTGERARIEMGVIGNDGDHAVYSAYFNVPVRPGDSYEDWCAVMQIDRIKEYDIRPEQQGDRIGLFLG